MADVQVRALIDALHLTLSVYTAFSTWIETYFLSSDSELFSKHITSTTVSVAL